MQKIRVGMIRCDVHAAWYALLFQKADEQLVLQRYPQCHYYFYYRHKLKFGLVPGFELAKVYDPFPRHVGITYPEGDDRGSAELLAETFGGKATVCKTLEELSDGVDLVFIADCLEEGKDHLELATPGLKKGVPTFVDKPFAYTLADARAIIDLAQENNTPVMNASLLRVNPLTERFRNRFAEIEPVGMGVVKGVGSSGLDAVIHTLSLAQHAFGQGVEWVQSMGTIPLEFVRMHYPSDHPDLPNGVEVLAISSHLPGPNCGFRCEAYSKKGAIHSPWIDDYQFPLGGRVIMQKLKAMVETRRPRIPYDAMLEPFRIVEAARKSQAGGSTPVYLNDIADQ